MQIAIVLNPAAGRGAGARLRSRIEKWSAAEKVDAVICQTKRAGEATELAANAARDGASIVVAAGGDGTLNEVLNGIYDTGAKLGILPVGTGNDFARCAGIGAEVENGFRVLERGLSRPVDVGKITVGEQSRLFLNVCGAGFDSRVAARINDHRPPILARMSGTAAYLIAVAAELRSFQKTPIRLQLDEKTIEARAVLCAVANAQSYGGGMKVAPDANFSDGLFDVCLIKDLSRWQFLRAFPGVFSGKHIRHPSVEMFRAHRVQLESETPLPVLVDGEILGQTPATFEILPRAIEVVLPL